MRATRSEGSVLVGVLCVCLLISGCRKYLPFEGENKPPRLVLNGQMEADSVFRVDLSHSLGYIDIGEIQGVENGTVEIRLADGQFVETLVHVGEGHYRGEQVAVAGQRYRVDAAAGSYTPIFGVDVVPPGVPIVSWDTIREVSSDPFFQSTNFNVSIRINDPPGVTNYYMLEGYHVRTYDIYWVGSHPITGLDIYDTLYFDEPIRTVITLSSADLVLTSEFDSGIGETEIFGNRFLFSDDLFNGTSRQFQFKTQYYMNNGQIEVQLTSLSADLFRYYRTYERYQNTEGDPFSEPVQVFTNIQGDGLGIWGGRSGYSVMFEL